MGGGEFWAQRGEAGLGCPCGSLFPLLCEPGPLPAHSGLASMASPRCGTPAMARLRHPVLGSYVLQLWINRSAYFQGVVL